MYKIAFFIHKADEWIWGPGMLLLLLGTGSYLMIRLRFLPLRRLKYALLCTIGREKASAAETREEPVSKEASVAETREEPVSKEASAAETREEPVSKEASAAETTGERVSKKSPQRKGVSSFSSLTTELAATIGTGNIVGVATAMVLGGPGALLWMIVSAFLGMSTKLVESMLSVKYHVINDRGERVGGPMYTLQRAFPSKRVGKLLGSLFAAFAVLASFGMGNMTQSNSIADALQVSFAFPKEAVGLVVTLVTILAVLGGIQSIARLTSVLVPFMGIFYMLGAFWVIVAHRGSLPAGLRDIAVMAFCPEAAAGGLAGHMTITVQEALRYGVSRGVFSNEAGLGAAGISAAAADTEDAVRQGYISMTGVFIDTVVICLVTGLALSSSGVLGRVDEKGELLTGTKLTIAAFQTTFGEWGAYFISICITLFAFATIVGWAYQGEKAFEFLMGHSRYCMLYRFVYALITFVGAVSSLEVVWEFSDICNALMAIPNLAGVLVLSSEACRDIRKHAKA